jgi:basic amino acid/polyamine antiporter, APA family
LATNPSIAPDNPISRGKLLQVLGIWFGISAAIGNAISAGIVRTPGDIAKNLPQAQLFLAVWIIGGLYAFLSAPAMAELGAAIPRSGGQYNFSRRAIGEYAGFIVGWSDWLSTCGTAAAIAIVIWEYSGQFFPLLAGYKLAFSTVVIVSFTVLQWRGIRLGSGAQLLTGAMKTLGFLVLVVACFSLGGKSHAIAANVNSVALGLSSGWPLAAAFMLGLQAVIFTIDGWDGIIYFGEEVRNPGRDVPRAIFGSVFSVMGIYLLLNLVSLYVVPMKDLAGNNFVLGTVANLVFGRLGDPIIRSIMLVSLLSAMNANQLFCPRTLYAMSTDGLFFRAATKVNAGGTPTVALLLSTIAGVLFLLTGTFERVIAMLSFFFVANYTLTYASLFLLRKREPNLDRPYHAWGYPWTTGIALGGSILFLIGSLVTDRENAPWSLAILALSYPIYLILNWTRRNASHRLNDN